jgi:hypothetical protein
MKKYNVVLITSVIRGAAESPFRNGDERLAETINTIKSIRDKIPNSYIVLLEGGEYSLSDYNTLKDIVEEYHCHSVKGLHRSKGEISLLSNYLDNEFQQIKELSKTLNKVSGRYYLNENFSFNENLNSIKKDDVAWSGRGACSTRYWRVTSENINMCIEKIKLVKETFDPTIDVDLEHAFYQHQVVPLHDSTDKMDVGVTGFVSPMGIWDNA